VQRASFLWALGCGERHDVTRNFSRSPRTDVALIRLNASVHCYPLFVTLFFLHSIVLVFQGDLGGEFLRSLSSCRFLLLGRALTWSRTLCILPTRTFYTVVRATTSSSTSSFVLSCNDTPVCATTVHHTKKSSGHQTSSAGLPVGGFAVQIVVLWVGTYLIQQKVRYQFHPLLTLSSPRGLCNRLRPADTNARYGTECCHKAPSERVRLTR
jgi:hypothetical protein